MSIDWFGWFPNTPAGFHLLGMIIAITGLSIFLQRPRKGYYTNFFMAWLVYLSVLISAMAFLWLLVYFKIIPEKIIPGFDLVYWAIIGVTVSVYVGVLMNSFAKKLKIKRPIRVCAKCGAQDRKSTR